MSKLPLYQHMRMWWGHIACLLAGACLPFSLAPFNLWPLGIIAATVLALCLRGKNGKQCIALSFLFGLGMYGNGVYWVFGAIHEFGNASSSLAFFMTAIFVAGVALVFALPFYVYGRVLAKSRIGYVLGFAAVWVMGEWSRTWFLTGFPWLFVGYAHIDTWLSGWAPVFGVLGISFIAVASGALLCEVIYEFIRTVNPNKSGHPLRFISFSVLLVLFWGGGLHFTGDTWNTKTEEKISVAIVQPNIPLEVKWNPLYRSFILNVLRDETAPHWDKDLIVWPEASIPLMYNDAGEFFAEIEELTKDNDSALITGILYDQEEPRTFFNSITGFGNAEGLYFKKRLVPFGEYVPLEHYLRGLIDFFNLPNSIITPGPWEQSILSYKNYKISPSICYEIVYPDLVTDMAKDAQLLITISNDAWFGDSIGPKQHFQMAQMRALENHRYVIRATNTGISGFIGPLGQVVQYGTAFQRESITDTVELVSGTTPFMRWGSAPIIWLAIILFLAHGLPGILSRQRSIVNLPD